MLILENRAVDVGNRRCQMTDAGKTGRLTALVWACPGRYGDVVYGIRPRSVYCKV